MSGTKSGCLGVLVRLGRCPLPSAMLRQILLKGLNATHSPCLPTILLSATRTPPLTYSPNHRRKDRHHLWPAIGMRNCTSLHHVRLLSGRAGRQRRLRASTRRARLPSESPASTMNTIPRGRRDSLYRIGQKPRPPRFPDSRKRQQRSWRLPRLRQWHR